MTKMNEWRETTLGEVLQPKGYIRGPFGSALRRNELLNNGVPVYEQQHAIYGIRTFRFFISEEKFKEMRRFAVQTDDLIISCSGTIGKVSRIQKSDGRGIISQALLLLRANKEKIHPLYLQYILSSKEGFNSIVSRSSGSVQVNIARREIIESIPLTLPTLPEQDKILAVLSSLDDKIDLLTQQNVILEALAQTYFQQWLETHKGDQRNVGDFLESTLGGEWGEDTASDSHPMPVYCLRGTDVAMLTTGLASKIPLRYIKPSKYERIILTSRDLILEISGGTDTQSTGRVTYINDRVKALFDLPIVFSNFCRCLRFKKEEYIYPFYLYIKGKWENDEFFNLENGSSGIHNLDYKTFLYSTKYTDTFPCDEDFIVFSKYVSSFFEKIDRNKLQIITLQKLRDTLLPKLINGEVQVRQ